MAGTGCGCENNEDCGRASGSSICTVCPLCPPWLPGSCCGSRWGACVCHSHESRERTEMTKVTDGAGSHTVQFPFACMKVSKANKALRSILFEWSILP
eukprot:scaffold124905_cov40-Prasinocladus_malaysianus.AAC.1